MTTTTADFSTFIAAQMLGGAGLALFFVPLNVVLLRSIAPASVPAALALQRLLQQLGGSVASALLITYADSRFAAHDALLRGSVVSSAPAAGRFIDIARAHHASFTGMTATLSHLVRAQDQALALADATMLVGIVGCVAVPLVLLFKKSAPAVP